MKDQPRNDLPYEAAMHGMQSGVAFEMEREECGPARRNQPALAAELNVREKHLRVGINSALINDAALVRLLIKKGVFTQEEYTEEVRLEANRELDRYEDHIRNMVRSGTITLR